MPNLAASALAAGELARRCQPTLAIDEVVVRPWLPSDAADVVRAYADPAIQRWHVRTMTDDEASAWIASRAARWQAETGADWAVTDGENLMGRVGLRSLDLAEGLAEVSYWVLATGRGRNVAPRALTTMSNWLFNELGLQRIELTHSTLNVASCRVAQKCGFRLEGTMRGQALHADGWHDMHLHARLKTDEVVEPIGNV